MLFHGSTPAEELRAAIVAAAGPVRRVTADYLDAEWVEEQFGTRPVLPIGVVNCTIPRENRQSLYERIGELAVEWLRGRSLAKPGTMIPISFLRELDLIVMSISWGDGGTKFWLDADGRLTTEQPLPMLDE